MKSAKPCTHEQVSGFSPKSKGVFEVLWIETWTLQHAGDIHLKARKRSQGMAGTEVHRG